MHQPPNLPAPEPIKVHAKPAMPIIYIVVGSVLLAIGLFALTLGGFSFWLIIGPLLIAAGIAGFYNPIISFDTMQGTLWMHGPLGNKARTYGAAKGERLVFDGADIVRLLPNGKQKIVKTRYGKPEDVQALQQAIAALAQPQPGQPQGSGPQG